MEYFACMCVHVPYAFFVPAKPEEGIRSLGTKVKHGCEPQCGYWESNLGLQEQEVLLTTIPSLQPQNSLLLCPKTVIYTIHG